MLFSVETWINAAHNCPNCKRETENTDIQILYFSSNQHSTRDETELDAMVKVATMKERETKVALKESRLANKLLLFEIDEYKTKAVDSALAANKSAAAANASAAVANASANAVTKYAQELSDFEKYEQLYLICKYNMMY
jgi:hypothetical protein